MLTKRIDTDLVQAISSLEKSIGNTPLFPITNLFQNKEVQVYAKVEWEQFGGSIKARAAFNIIKHAILNGDLNKDKVLLDASSGNTGIAYASICSALNIPVAICIPENASESRKVKLQELGAEIVYTSPFESTEGSQKVAREMKSERPDQYYYADQYGNENNWKAHYHGTAEEIIAQTNGTITHFVAGLGTTGTMTGSGRKLKEFNENIQLVALQPDFALHGLEGWKHIPTAGAPAIYDDEVHNEIKTVSTDDAFDMIVQANEKEGLQLSPSSAANLSGAIDLAGRIEKGVIVTVLPDNSDKYGEVMKELFK